MSAPPHHPDSATPPRSPFPRRRRGRWGTALVLGLGAAAVLLPDLVGLDRWFPFAQLIAFRPLFTGVLAVIVVLALLVTTFARRFWPVPVLLALVALIAGSLVLPRTQAEPAPTGGRPLKVLALNVFEGQADADSLAALIRTEAPDIVSVPESGGRFESQLAPLIEPLGYRTAASVSARSADVRGNTVAWSQRLGDVRTRVLDETQFEAIEATGGGLGDLRFVAFHSVAPMPNSVGQWRNDLGTVDQWCSAGSPAVVAGDFNASYDHSLFRKAIDGCSDAGASTGNGLLGTWPTWAPEWMGPQIDHILSNQGITAESFGVRQVPGTDHRAIVATLRLP
ncbi:endonuclease/exonuclease/phosphatase family protein [Pseudonocardia phyllosphaerae]|uniref:endonuclease/exonuclease/phosphatase family protein n=1 Tax=Pseudonocardia phyllosphaerae TaxID=3390502 RepID=UPI00397D2E23